MTPVTAFLCGGDFTLHPDTESDCPVRDTHSPMSAGYVDRAEWALAMLSRGARNLRCGMCGLYAIWTPPVRPMPMGRRR